MPNPETPQYQFHISDVFFVVALMLAVWFALSAWVWGYFANLILALPAGLASLLFWFLGKRNTPRPKRFRFIPYILILGLAVSLGFLLYLLVFAR